MKNIFESNDFENELTNMIEETKNDIENGDVIIIGNTEETETLEMFV